MNDVPTIVVEFTARVANLSLDEDIFPAYATASHAREAREWAGGMNWDLNRNVLRTVNYIHTDIEGGGSVAQAVWARVQLSF